MLVVEVRLEGITELEVERRWMGCAVCRDYEQRRQGRHRKKLSAPPGAPRSLSGQTENRTDFALLSSPHEFLVSNKVDKEGSQHDKRICYWIRFETRPFDEGFHPVTRTSGE